MYGLDDDDDDDDDDEDLYSRTSCLSFFEPLNFCPPNEWIWDSSSGIDHEEAEISSQFREWLEVPVRAQILVDMVGAQLMDKSPFYFLFRW